MSSPNQNKPLPNDKELPFIPKRVSLRRRRRESVYTQSRAGPVLPRATSFGQNDSTFYSFPRLPETPAQTAAKKKPFRSASFSERIASGIRSLLSRPRDGEKAHVKEPLLTLSQAEFQAGQSQKTEDGAHVFCQHLLDDACQCTVTMPIAVGRNLCQTCADGKCTAASTGETPLRDLKCRHLWDDKCRCTRNALWVTGDELCGPCWYGQCEADKSGESGSDGTRK